jgi:PAS domain S-box-containing protein
MTPTRIEHHLAQLAAIVESSQDAIIGATVDGEITLWNAAAERLYGYRAEEVIGKHISLLIPAGQPDEVPQLIASAVAGTGVDDIEARHARKDGKLVDVSLTVSPVCDAAGRVIGISTIARDMTERKRAQDVLRASEERYRTLVENLHLGITLIDAQHRILAINHAHAEMVGRKVQECLGSECFRVFEKRNQVCAHCPGSVAMRTGRRAEVETIGIRDDGSTYVARVQAFPVPDASGRPCSFIELVEDITGHRQAERELTAAKQSAEAANRAKSEFLANMSHEIRTPLSAVLGFADLLLESVHTPEAIDAAKTIKRNGQYLLELLNGVLDLSKIEAGKLALEPSPCSPSEILREVVSLMRVRADAKRLPLELECDGTIPERIQSDRTRLRQILVNLVGNAIKFTETGEVRIVVRARPAEQRKTRLEIDVRDTGIGMNEQHVSRLFQPFTQADASTSRRFGGTGLGLTISKRLAEMLGGTLAVRSRLGEGTTFTLSFDVTAIDRPCVPLPAPSAETADRATSQPSAGPTRLAGRVLLAEDGLDNQRLLSYILGRAGLEVTLADNGQVAVELVRRSVAEGRPFDLVLMDIQMPVMDGYEATRALRAAGWTRPIIAVTAHAMLEDRQRCLDAGCEDYLPKPIDRQQLLDLVRRYLRGAAAAVVGL